VQRRLSRTAILVQPEGLLHIGIGRLSAVQLHENGSLWLRTWTAPRVLAEEVQLPPCSPALATWAVEDHLSKVVTAVEAGLALAFTEIGVEATRQAGGAT
jgi:hypothetical protein